MPTDRCRVLRTLMVFIGLHMYTASRHAAIYLPVELKWSHSFLCSISFSTTLALSSCLEVIFFPQVRETIHDVFGVSIHCQPELDSITVERVFHEVRENALCFCGKQLRINNSNIRPCVVAGDAIFEKNCSKRVTRGNICHF